MPNQRGRPYEIRATWGAGLDADPTEWIWFTAEQASQLVNGAVRTGRIAASSAPAWRQRVLAGGREGGTAIATLVQLAPGPDGSGAGPMSGDEIYDQLYPEAPPARPPREPDWLAMHDQRRAWLAASAADPREPERQHFQAARRHAHGMTIGPGAATDPVSAGIAAKAAADPGGPMSLDDIYRALYSELMDVPGRALKPPPPLSSVSPATAGSSFRGARGAKAVRTDRRLRPQLDGGRARDPAVLWRTTPLARPARIRRPLTLNCGRRGPACGNAVRYAVSGTTASGREASSTQ
jgi:hypothetical protein